MSIFGYKNCPHCGGETPLKYKALMSFKNLSTTCRKCGKTYTYSNMRRWIALILLLAIIFIPTVVVFNNLELMGDYLYLKYLLAFLVYYAIAGNSRASSA